MKVNIFHIFLYVAIALTYMPREASAQRPALGKLSSQLRMLMNDADRQKAAKRRGETDAGLNPTVCAFVRTSSAADTTTLKAEGCRVLASLGDITIAAMPLNSVAALSRRSCVLRIEAQRGNTVALDSLGLIINVRPCTRAGTCHRRSTAQELLWACRTWASTSPTPPFSATTHDGGA